MKSEFSPFTPTRIQTGCLLKKITFEKDPLFYYTVNFQAYVYVLVQLERDLDHGMN